MELEIKDIDLIDEKELRDIFKEIIRQMDGEVDESNDRIYLPPILSKRIKELIKKNKKNG